MYENFASLLKSIYHKQSCKRIETHAYHSPRSPTFWQFIEIEMHGLIDAFKKKGYLTFSSCAGHDIYGRSFVAIAFPDLLTSNEFIAHFNQWSISVFGFNKYVWAKMKLLRDYEDYDKNDNLIEFDEERHLAMINHYNKCFFRGYKEYVMVEITMGPNNPPKFSLAFLKLAYWKIFKREQAIKDVEAYVENLAKRYAM